MHWTVHGRFGKTGTLLHALFCFYFLELFCHSHSAYRYHVESQSHMVRSQTRSRVRHRSVAPGLDSKKSKMHIFSLLVELVRLAHCKAKHVYLLEKTSNKNITWILEKSKISFSNQNQHIWILGLRDHGSSTWNVQDFSARNPADQNQPSSSQLITILKKTFQIPWHGSQISPSRLGTFESKESKESKECLRSLRSCSLELWCMLESALRSACLRSETRCLRSQRMLHSSQFPRCSWSWQKYHIYICMM